MPKKRLISYRAMAVMCVTGGAISLASVVALWLLGSPGGDPDTPAQALGAIGIIAWFLGMAAGILTLSTRFARWGMLGLALGVIAMLSVFISGMLQAA